MSREISPLERSRAAFKPGAPSCLLGPVENLSLQEGDVMRVNADEEAISLLFPRTYGRPVLKLVQGEGNSGGKPLRVGTVLSGGQAPGGHNVIAGLLDGMKAVDPDSKLYGFIAGPKGIYQGQYVELTPEVIDRYRNTGGFDMIGSGRDKIETAEQLANSADICRKLELDGLVIIGGDDSNTNAAVLAEYFLEQEVSTVVIGIPKTIDGDLQNDYVEISFGFDTATKVYSELIGNICRDAHSSKKYWHFIKLMGRNASHVTLECAFQTRPNLALIGEEVWDKEITLDQIVKKIADVIRRRADQGKNYGICLVPEGLIGFFPSSNTLIEELNHILAKHDDYLQKIGGKAERKDYIESMLGRPSRLVYKGLPDGLERQLLMERDSHGNLQVSRIQTERLLIEEVGRLLRKLKAEGKYNGKFATQTHFLGYEGRSVAPTNFDASYAYTLGRTATVMVHHRKTGYMCGVRNLVKPVEDWEPYGVPITALLNMEVRKGRRQPVIRKALVQIDGRSFRTFVENRERWAMNEEYVFPGAIQYFGPPEICDRPPMTVSMDRGGDG
jgi:pyrophosphate--fructose-6-phosphate 1-phosphotransferase